MSRRKTRRHKRLDEEADDQAEQARLRRLLLAATEKAKLVEPEPYNSAARTYYREVGWFLVLLLLHASLSAAAPAFCKSPAVPATQKPTLTHLRLSEMAAANPEKDLWKAINRHDLRFVGIYGFSLDVPGLMGAKVNPLVRLKGVNAVEGTSDAIQSTRQERLQSRAERYALRYNRSLLGFIKRSDDPDLRLVRQQTDAELGAMEKSDPFSDARKALQHGDRRILELCGQRGAPGLTEEQSEEVPVRWLAASDDLTTDQQRARLRRLTLSYVAPYNRAIRREEIKPKRLQ